MVKDRKDPWYIRLLHNSRFWILAVLVVLSVNIAGFIQYQVPPGTLQVTRMEQVYGFVAMLLLYVAILASPLTKLLPRLPFKDAYLHARRAIGVSAFYYAFLHVYITFFDQLGGFGGIGYFNATYNASFIFGILTLWVLFLMAATSFDWVVKKMSFRKWKILHRFVYFASIALLLHIMLIGPHYTNLSPLGVITYVAAAVLVVLEILRIRLNLRQRKLNKS